MAPEIIDEKVEHAQPDDEYDWGESRAPPDGDEKNEKNSEKIVDHLGLHPNQLFDGVCKADIFFSFFSEAPEM